MTIHKSKGLEFDIVILPELDADLHGATPGVVVGRQAPTEPVDCVSIYRKKEIQKLLSADFQAAFSNWTGDAVTQSLCVLYVAITRARHACYMLIPPATGKSDTLRSTLSGLLRKGLTESGTRAEPDTLLFQTGNPDWYLQVDDPKSNAGRVPAAAQQPSPIRLAPMPDGRQRGLITVIPSELEGGRTVRIHELLSLDRAERLERGTLLHRWFEEIRWLDEGLPDEQRLRSIAGLHGFQGAHIEAELARFRSFLQNPTIVSLLSQQAFEGACPPDLSADVCGLINSSRIRLEVHCEWGFTAPGTEGSLTTGIIDRLVLIFDAECHELLAVDIIDYKTDEIADGQLAADTRAGFYTHQMQAYRSAIQNLYRIPQNRISARLLFVTTGTVCAVPAGQDHSDH